MAVAMEWLEKQRPTWAKSHADNVEGRFRNYVFPHYEERPISEINPPELLLMQVSGVAYFTLSIGLKKRK